MLRFVLLSLLPLLPSVLLRAEELPSDFKVLATFNYPGSSHTIPRGINQHGDVAGDFSDSSGGHGFVRYRNGTFSPPITHPNDMDGETFALDLNRNAVAGFYVDLTTFALHSFLLINNRFIDIDIPGAASTTVLGLNTTGNYCGSFDDGSGTMQAFVVKTGDLTVFRIPGSTFTSANAINQHDDVAGVYQLGDTNNHGFVRDTAGALTFIDYPGATSTILRGISSDGSLAGGYVDSRQVQHGFVFLPPNRFISYTYPASTFTTFEGINDKGVVCGQYTDLEGQRHGFILRVR